tara:strand:- start:70 stop:450 length:381 start_codon:yes stop_codon:yes gene_type:complete
MKFEANIPSYLKTGSGSFPVGGQSISKEKKTTNLYEQARKGFEMSLTNDDDKVLYSPLGMQTAVEPSFLETMQEKASKKEVKTAMPEELSKLEQDSSEQLAMSPTQLSGDVKNTDEIETDEDIFIG